MSENAVCPLCGADSRELGSVNGELLRRCSGCGVGFLWPQPSDAQLAEAYAEAYGEDGAKFIGPIEGLMRLAARAEARAIRDVLPPSAHFLDVGCGRGVVVSELARLGVRCVGVEQHADAARGLDPRVDLVVAPDLKSAGLPLAHFDMVMFRHVLEHLRDPTASLTAAIDLLKPGGALLVEVPHFGSLQAAAMGRHWFHLDAPRHLFHFTAPALEALLRRVGFLDVQVEAKVSPVQDPIGWLQSGLHWAGTPHQRLYRSLHRGARRGAGFFWDAAAVAAFLPAATALTALDGVLRGGGVLRAHARRR